VHEICNKSDGNNCLCILYTTLIMYLLLMGKNVIYIE
jgi:hypothetical protein